MGAFEYFPYTNFHDLNLDWIVQELEKLTGDVRDFISINAIKYADPIQWDITRQYEKNTVVLDKDGNAYLSVQAVPAGVSLDRTEYWTIIGNFSALWESVKQAITIPDEGHGTTASSARTVNTLVWVNDVLLEVTKEMDAGDQYNTNPDGNCRKYTMQILLTETLEALKNLADSDTALNNKIDKETTNRENADAELNDKIDKETTNRKNADAELNDKIEDAAVFKNVKFYGAVGDGVTDDTEAFRSAFVNLGAKIFIPDGTYKITDQIEIKSNTEIKCFGTILHTISTQGKATFNIDTQENVVFDGLQILGTGAVDAEPVYSYCLHFINSKNCIVKNSNFKDIQSANTIDFEKCDGAFVEKCKIENYTRSGITATNGTNNVYFIENNVLNCVNKTTANTYPIALCGWDFKLTGEPMPHNLNALYNYIENEIPWWEGIDAHGGHDIKIIGNTVKGCYTGIAAFSSKTENFDIESCLISNNYVELGTNRATVRNVDNLGCIISGKNVVISNNIFKNCGLLNYTLVDTVSYVYGFYVVEAENCKFENNIIENSRGIIFELRSAKNVEIKNNKIVDSIGKPGTFSNCIFNIRAGVEIESLFAENNIGTGNTGYTLVSDMHSGNVQNAYIKIVNNNFENVTAPAQTQTITEQTNINSVKMGRVGDFIRKQPPALNTPFGWTCVTAWVNGAGGSWAPLSNIPPNE